MNKMRYLRIGVATAVLVVIFACTFAHVPIGTLCALCPVGFTEVMLAGGSIPWPLLPGVLIVLAVVFILGRVFCSWVCPTSWLRNVFGGKKPRGLTGRTGVCAGCKSACVAGDEDPRKSDDGSAASGDEELNAGVGSDADTLERASGAPNDARVRNNLLAQGMVLAVLLVVSFIVHFPVFCLFCPIGLVFGTMFAVSRMFVTWQPGWELIVFPAILILELFVLRRWCSAICPLGFFFGLMAKARSKIEFLPKVKADEKACIHSEGCNVCATVCPEDISVPTSARCDLEDCTLCLDCKEHCPTHAIGIKGK